MAIEVRPATRFSDVAKMLGPKKNPDGSYGFTLPMDDAKLPGIAAEDIGRCAYGRPSFGPGSVPS